MDGQNDHNKVGVSSVDRNAIRSTRRTQRRAIMNGSPIPRGTSKKKLLPTQNSNLSTSSHDTATGSIVRKSSVKKKKKPQPSHASRIRKRGRNCIQFALLTLFIITGCFVMNLVYIKNMLGQGITGNSSGSMSSSYVSVHNLLRRRNFTVLKSPGEKLKSSVAAPVKGGNAKSIVNNKYYDRVELRKEYEKATSHLPEFPPNYIGTIPPDNYNIQTDYNPLGGHRFEEYKTGDEPYHITEALIEQSDELARHRRSFIKNAMQHAWNGYTKYAFGMDEVLPKSGSSSNRWGGLGITLVDSLDTLWLMGMKDEFYKCRDWVRDHLNHSRVRQNVSVFETTIRSLGGLLAAYDWSKDNVFLDQALDLGKRLIKSFDNSPTGIPNGQVSLRDTTGEEPNYQSFGGGSRSALAEFGTIQVEFRYLAKAMHGEQQTQEYAYKTERVFEILNEISPSNGLFPYYVFSSPAGHKQSVEHQQKHRELVKPGFANDKLTFGAMADSFYEYMLKLWIQGGKQEPMYRDMYDKAMQGMYDELLQVTTPTGLLYLADKNKNSGTLDHKMDHLACFMGGLLALGAYTDPLGIDSSRAQKDLKTARGLTYTCYQMYARMETGISPEYAVFPTHDPLTDLKAGPAASHYLLRPETVESLFILNFLTNDPIYREWGWEIFQSIEKYCKTEIAYGSLPNVNSKDMGPQDSMESFFIAETLKYLYLLMDPDTEVDILNKHVFNTEAHPTRIFPVFDEEE